MILRQQFKTMEGAMKRAAFENAHSRTHRFAIVRFHVGAVDLLPLSQQRWPWYHWRVEKTAYTF